MLHLLRRVLFLTIAVAVGLGASAASAASITADFRETLDLFFFGEGPRILEHLEVEVGEGPELTEEHEVENPSWWGDSLEVDLDPDSLELTLTPTSDNCYGYITVELENVSIGDPDDEIRGLERIAAKAFEEDLRLERTVTFSHDRIEIDSRVPPLDEEDTCPLQLLDPPAADRYQMNPIDRVDQGFVGATMRFREEAEVVGMGGPRVLEVTGVVPGPGYELTDADEMENPEGLGQSLQVDLDPETGMLTLTPTDNGCYGRITITLDEITWVDPRRQIVGLLRLGTGAFETQPEASARFTPNSVVIDYRGGTCDLLLGDGSASDTYRVLTAAVPEPGAVAGPVALATLTAIAARRRRRAPR